MTSISAKIISSWREKAREESRYEFFWPRHITSADGIDIEVLLARWGTDRLYLSNGQEVEVNL